MILKAGDIIKSKSTSVVYELRTHNWDGVEALPGSIYARRVDATPSQPWAEIHIPSLTTGMLWEIISLSNSESPSTLPQIDGDW